MAPGQHGLAAALAAGATADLMGQLDPGRQARRRPSNRVDPAPRGDPRPALRAGSPRPGDRDVRAAGYVEVQLLALYGRLNRVCILIARPMSPLIFSLPCMKAEVPSIVPVMIFTQSPESA